MLSRFSNQRLLSILFVLFSLLSFQLRAEPKPDVFTGTLGKMPIVLELDLSDPAEITGRYFYQKYRSDLELSGTLQNPDSLSLLEGSKDFNDKPRPSLILHKTSESGWKGDWRDSTGKNLQVLLSPAKPSSPATNAEAFWKKLFDEKPYEYLRLFDVKLEKGKQQTFMGYRLQWWQEPRSQITLFEIVSGYPSEQRQRINERLRAYLWTEVVEYHSCQLQAGGDGDYMQTVTPELLSPNVVSIDVSTSASCGGAHPGYGQLPINLNAHNAKPLALEDILWIGDGKPFHYPDGRDLKDDEFEVYSAYRVDRLAPWIVKTLQKLHPGELIDKDIDESCDSGDPDVWDFPAWYLTTEGIILWSSFPHAIRVCDAGWLIPYAIVKQHPGGISLALP